MGDDQGGAVEAGRHGGHGEGLARARDAQKDVVALARFEAAGEGFDGRGLIARGLEGSDQVQLVRHGAYLQTGSLFAFGDSAKEEREQGEREREARMKKGHLAPHLASSPNPPAIA